MTEGARPEQPEESLFELANAIAALLDAPVTIEDRESRVMAYSDLQDQADASRVATILGRQVPEPYHRILAERGVFRQIQHSDGPVLVDPVTTQPDEVALPRVAASVRAGDEQLGSIWVAVHDSLSATQMQALQDATKVVARQLLRARHRQGDAREAVAALVRTAVAGGAEAHESLHLLGLGSRSVAVLVLAGPARGDLEDDPAALAEQQRLADAFAVHLTGAHPRSATAPAGGTMLGLFPVPDGDADEAAVRVATDFLARTPEGCSASIGVGSSARDADAVVRSRRLAERALEVLLAGGHERRAARLPDVHVESLLLDLADAAEARGDVPTGPVARLLVYDAKNNTRLVDSLRAWLEAFGDVVTASAAVFVHPNTFRYRLGRISEVSGMDLRDSDERFAAMLQLRVLAARSR
ncbi:MAG: putative transcriptional regulator, PucR family [Nocardioides sp.]|nr:putative transcriptional regulator, PucR family [Nocardioides sp.]